MQVVKKDNPEQSVDWINFALAVVGLTLGPLEYRLKSELTGFLFRAAFEVGFFDRLRGYSMAKNLRFRSDGLSIGSTSQLCSQEFREVGIYFLLLLCDKYLNEPILVNPLPPKYNPLSQVNDDLIRGVFNEIVKYRPALAKYLIPDDDDSVVDVRLLADQVIKSFPWPIGVELRRLFSGTNRSLDRGRLDQLFKTLERTTQFLSFVMIIELYEEILNKRMETDEKFKSQFASRFTQLSLGNFTWLIRAIGNLFKTRDVEYFMPEMKSMLTDVFYKSLDFWVPERNEIGHYQINLTQEEIEKRCVEYSDKLSSILQTIAFITKYKLVTIREIKVNKQRHKEAQYVHWMDILNSSDSDFKSMEEVLESFSDSKAVLLMKSVKQPKEFLNLSPLIIDTRTEVIDTKEKFNIKKDIFMYTKYRNKRLWYVGTEVTEQCDLTNLSNYQFLVDDFENLMEKLGSVIAVNPA